VRGNLGIGLFARVEAVILSNGSLVAREIETRMPGVSGAADDSKVDIRGVIQRMNEDGTLIQVNGIVIEIADNTRMEGVPRVGASVTGHGVLQSDGTVLARSLRVFGISDSVEKFRERIRGIIDEVILDDDGKVIGIVVDGRSIRIEVLTKIETSLKKGNYVEVEGILGNQGFIAQEVDQQDDQDETEDAEDDGQAEPAPAVRIMTGNTSASSRTVRHEGVVEALERRATIGSTMVGFIWVGGQRFAVTANTKIEDGVLAVGSYVEVEARANGDTMIALTIEIEEPDNDDTRGNNSNNSGSGSSGRNSG
jgi:hypothetical protein